MNKFVEEYRRQLEKGLIQEGYRLLLGFIRDLRIELMNKYSKNFVVGNLYQGQMDVTYFTFTPLALKDKKLKVVLIFNYEKFRFEAWLVGQNKEIQNKYWKIVYGKAEENIYSIPLNSDEAILKAILVENSDVSTPALLVTQIETELLKFVKNVEHYF